MASLVHHKVAPEEMDTWFVNYVRSKGELGVTALAVIFAVLIVIWMGYVKKARWTWFVMFVIVWGWAFPLFMLPLVQHPLAVTLAQLVSDAFRESGIARDVTKQFLVFSLMVIALILPIRSFFWKRSAQS